VRIALFDLDGTLTPLDTEDTWIRSIGAAGLGDVAPHQKFHDDYHAGHMDKAAYLAWYTALLAGLPAADVVRLGAAVTETVVASVGPLRRTWIARERERSDTLLLVSASNAFLVDPIARALGLDGTIASEYVMEGGRFTGALGAEYNIGPAKLRNVERWLAARGRAWGDLERVGCYADSINDLTLLAASSHPFAVDPAPALEREAFTRGWPILRGERSA
jgi:HAD superfamily hydrolase (TIGR01490 family)